MNHVVLLNSYWENVKAALPEALVNTVVGIVVVFVALVFISMVISLFRYVSVFEKWRSERKEKKAGKKQSLSEQAVENTVQQIIEAEEEELSDTELVAVITAAIYAYEQAQGNQVTDGLVVRSIRKSSRANWQNA